MPQDDDECIVVCDSPVLPLRRPVAVSVEDAAIAISDDDCDDDCVEVPVSDAGKLRLDCCSSPVGLEQLHRRLDLAGADLPST